MLNSKKLVTMLAISFLILLFPGVQIPSLGKMAVIGDSISNASAATSTPVNNPTVTPTDTPVTAQTAYKITGYIAPDLNSTKSDICSGFKAEIVGTGFSALTDTAGYFEIKNIPDTITNCTIKISKAGYLAKSITMPDPGSDLMLGTLTDPVQIWAGDIAKGGIQDNAINMADIMIIASSFNSVKGDERYNSECDLNMDNAVNMADIMIIAKHFNKTPADYPVTIPVGSNILNQPVISYDISETDSAVTLSWTASTDDSSLGGYNIYKDNVIIATTKSTAYTINNLDYCTTYIFKVEAFDKLGNKASSDNADVTPELTLSGDMTMNRDFYIRSGTANLNGHTLTVNGRIVQSGGAMWINGGNLTVSGDYLMQTETVNADNTLSYGPMS